jgi:hypothetical protein
LYGLQVIAKGGLPMLKKVFCGNGSTNLGGKTLITYV